MDRPQFHEVLEEIMGDGKVYFQPPTNLSMVYPCIRYERDQADTVFADNRPYRYTQRYKLTYISQTPDDAVKKAIAHLPMCLFNRFYTVGNLNHDVFVIYS
jgi:hypothetical protein